MHLSFRITEQHLKQLKNFEKKLMHYASQLKMLSKNEQSEVKKFAQISNIGASTRIENAQLTDIEVQWIDTILTSEGKTTSFAENKERIENKLSKERERSIEEVAGCREMLLIILNEYHKMIPLQEIDLRYLHERLLYHYPKARHYSGQYKTQPNSVVLENKITGERKMIFQTADAGPVTLAAMQDLVSWYNVMHNAQTETITVVCEFVFRFLAIHPFQDGNGRLGRGVFLLGLLQSTDEHLSYVAPFLAIDRYIEKHKELYYFTLNRCSNGKFLQNPQEYHIEYFFEFMLKILDESLEGIDLYRQKYRAITQLSDTAILVLNSFKEYPEMRLSTKQLVKLTQLPTRTIKYTLLMLTRKGLLQRYGQGSATNYQLTF